MAQKFSINTPVRLQGPVFKAFTESYAQMIEEHGASYAVNVALAFHLRKRGFQIPELETPGEKIARGQAKRWKSIKAEIKGELEKNEEKREQKRERDRRYRERVKAAKAAKPSTSKE